MPQTSSSRNPARQPRLLDQVRAAIRTKHYSRSTEKAYVHWIRKYILSHGKRHPREMGYVYVYGLKETTISMLAIRTTW